MVENHKHNGVDSPQVNPQDFEGFKINTSLRTDDSHEGNLELVNASGEYYITAFIDGEWRNIRLDAIAFDFGDGSDGAATISVDTTLTRDMFYSSLTIDASKILYPNGYKIFCQTTPVINGTISVAGGNGGNGTAGQTVSGNSTQGTGGAGGAAGTAVGSGTVAGSKAAAAGGRGGDGGGNQNQTAGSAGTNDTKSYITSSPTNSGAGGTGAYFTGSGHTPNGSAAGANGTTTRITRPTLSTAFHNEAAGVQFGSGASSGGGGAGGGGLFQTSPESCGGGGGGGGSGAPGGILWLCAPHIVVNSGGTLTAAGGNGGNGGNGGSGSGASGSNQGGGGGGGGAGGNGGLIMLISKSYTNNGTVTVAGGTGGSGGSAGTGATMSGQAGTGGQNANAGTIIHIQV